MVVEVSIAARLEAVANTSWVYGTRTTPIHSVCCAPIAIRGDGGLGFAHTRLHHATATDASAEPTNDGPKIKADESALAYLTLRDNDAPLSEWGIGPVSEGN